MVLPTLSYVLKSNNKVENSVYVRKVVNEGIVSNTYDGSSKSIYVLANKYALAEEAIEW